MKSVSRITAAVVAAGGASFIYQRIAEVRDRRRFPPPGRLVDIGGRRLHLVTAGQGSPAVVIIPALGESVLGWLYVLKGAPGPALPSRLPPLDLPPQDRVWKQSPRRVRRPGERSWPAH
jgi:hypothetical protein